MNEIEKILAWIGSAELSESCRVRVKVKKLHPDAVIPSKAHPTDAGFDITCVGQPKLEGNNFVYRTGLAFEIPDGYVGLLFPRSSVAKKDLVLSNCVGVLDCHYRGEVYAKFKFVKPLIGDEYETYMGGERIIQLVVLPIPNVELSEVGELSESDRGEGGFGSSGV